MQKLNELTDQERLELANWLKTLMADGRYQILLAEMDEKISEGSVKNDLCKEENGWDRGYVSGLRAARQMPFDIIETCGTDQDTPET